MFFAHYPQKRARIFILTMFLFLLGATLLLEACTKPHNPASLKDHPSRTPVLVFGDSLSAGYQVEEGLEWPALLEARMRQKGVLSDTQSVANYSKSGEDTEGGLRRLPQALDDTKPALVILELGANDALRRQDMSQTERRLKAMVDMAHAHGAKVVVVGADLPAKMFFVSTQHFTQVYERTEKEKNIVLVPNILDGVNSKSAYMQHDGLHPNAEGQPVMLENVWKGLEKALQ